ncbi:hypothetical protein ACIHFD_53140 [Nonomuraea sp. NPDC051941]
MSNVPHGLPRLGAEAGRRFSPATLRFLIVAVGGVALVHLLVR